MQDKTPCELYLAKLKPSGRASILGQLKQATRILNWQLPVEKQPFHQLTYAQIEYLKVCRNREGVSSRTINHLLYAVKSIARIGFMMGKTDERTYLQTQGIPMLKTPPSVKGQALTAEAVSSFMAELRMDRRPVKVRNTAIFSLFLATGLRRSELVQLKVKDIDHQQHAITVHNGKSGKSRIQYMSDWAYADLNNWLVIRGSGSGLVFNRFCGKALLAGDSISTTAIYKIVTRYTEELAGTKCSPHDLRRTYISQLLDSDVDVLTVSKMAGHASVNTTQIYDKRDHRTMVSSGRNLSFGDAGEGG